MGVDLQLLRDLENGHQGMVPCKAITASCRPGPFGTRDSRSGTGEFITHHPGSPQTKGRQETNGPP